MKTIKIRITTQAAFDALPMEFDERTDINIRCDIEIQQNRKNARYTIYACWRAVLYNSSTAVLHDSSRALLHDSSHAVLYNSSAAVLHDSSHAVLYNSSTATREASYSQFESQ